MKSKKITGRKATNICRARAAINDKILDNFFDNLAISFTSLYKDLKKIPPSSVFNYDETNLTNDPGKADVLVSRGHGRLERLQDHSKMAVSIMFCGSASGQILPPMVVYKALNLYNGWTQHGVPGAVYAVKNTGWFDMYSFSEWFQNIFLEQTKAIDGPKVLLGDNCGIHMNPEVFKLSQEHNVHFLFLPPNATHLLQPLDVAVFAPLKKHWGESLTK